MTTFRKVYASRNDFILWGPRCRGRCTNDHERRPSWQLLPLLHESPARRRLRRPLPFPSRFKWSVETSYPGADAQGLNLPDSRVMLRLYNPDKNFTAFTAQMDLATAARLHQELGEIIVKKLENPGFELHPQLYDPKLVPRGRFKGSVGNDGVLRIEVDKNGVPIIELEDTAAKQAK